MRRLVVVGTGAVVGLLALVACGNGSAPEGSPTPSASASATPSSPEPTTGPAGPTTASPSAGGCEPSLGEGMTPGVLTGMAVLSGIRADAEETFDRVVLEFDTPPGDVSVHDADAIYADPSGVLVEVDGNAFVEVSVQNAGADWAMVQQTDPADPVRRYTGARELRCTLPLVREVTLTGDFEAVLSFGIGLERAAPHEVTRLSAPERVVIDFSH